MSRSRMLVRWMPVVVLALLPVLHAVVVSATSSSALMLGFTPTATTPPPTTSPPTCEDCCPYGSRDCPTPCPTCTPDFVCDPIVTKRCEPAEVKPGDKVSFTIQVTNRGQQASVNAKVIDVVSEYLEIEEVNTSQGTWSKKGQTVAVDPGIIGQDYTVTILINARVRESAPTRVSIQNQVSFDADNCPYREAVCSWMLPETGGSNLWWTVAGGLGTVVLVLSLVLVQRRRSQ